MKKIVVTGGAGRLGRLTITGLLERGYEVLAIDKVRPQQPLPCRFLPVEMTEAAPVYDVLSGADAVLHLGAIPGPGGAPQSTIFYNNVLSTYHVVEAAAALRLQRLVFASTVFTVGWVAEPERYWPRYVPVDEDHPLTPFEAYGLSKQIGEDICATINRRAGLPIVSLRFMNIIWPEHAGTLPRPTPKTAKEIPFVVWAYVDARDAARACLQALEANTTGHEAMFIAAEDIRFDCPTRDLLRDLAPSPVEVKGSLKDMDSVISIQKARRVIGYKPQYSWQKGGMKA
jgi:nucleoside-diphosphate-sugar epimerase